MCVYVLSLSLIFFSAVPHTYLVRLSRIVSLRTWRRSSYITTSRYCPVFSFVGVFFFSCLTPSSRSILFPKLRADESTKVFRRQTPSIQDERRARIESLFLSTIRLPILLLSCTRRRNDLWPILSLLFFIGKHTTYRESESLALGVDGGKPGRRTKKN